MSGVRYRADQDELDDLDKARTPSPKPKESSPDPPRAQQPKDPRSRAKYNVFSRIFFLYDDTIKTLLSSANVATPLGPC